LKHALLSERFPNRADRWQLATRVLTLPRRPLLMGIVNVTPDSFSDGGRFLDPQRAIDQSLQLAADGADLIDIGAESTRPYADVVPVDEELRRLEPILGVVCQQVEVPVSIDTFKARVASLAVSVGVEIINDVTACRGDVDMIEVVRQSGAGICLMHMQGTPQTMQNAPQYDDVVEEIFAYLRERRDALVAGGVAAERICLDPGIGFGKSHQHNLTLLGHCGRFHALGHPLLVGHSRKGFIAKVIGDKQVDRTPGTIGVAAALAHQGIQILRVHDVAALRQALLLFEAIGGIDREVIDLGQ